MRHDISLKQSAIERITATAGVFFLFCSLAIPLLVAQDGSDAPFSASLEKWKAHGMYGITEEQRRVERDGEDQAVTDHVLNVPELDMEFVWIEEINAWVGRYEVTNAQYRRYLPDHESDTSRLEKDFNTDDRPVISVCYDLSDTLARVGRVRHFIDWLNEREREAGRLPEGWSFDLPTGDEWTNFARCGDGRAFPWGEGWPPAYGNYADETAQKHLSEHLAAFIKGYDDGHAHTAPVQESGRNDLGLFGVGGNVAEMTLERDDTGRIGVRGGSWGHSSPGTLTVDYRMWLEDRRHRSGHNLVGFRLVLAPR